MNRRNVATAACGLSMLLASPAAHAQTFTETFEGGSNVGGWTFGRGTLFPTGGNPGWCFRTTDLDTFAPQFTTTEPSVFTGDYRARNVTRLGIDLSIGSARNTGGRPLSLILISDNGTPGDFDDDWGAFVMGPNIPSADDAWYSYAFDVPSTGGSLPAGWEFIQFGGGAPDPDWGALIGNVGRVAFFYGDPRMFFIFQIWDTSADNVFITEGSTTPTCPADFDGDGSVNTADITAYLSAWFAARAGGPANGADFDGDGTVNTADITAYLSAWFTARAGGC